MRPIFPAPLRVGLSVCVLWLAPSVAWGQADLDEPEEESAVALGDPLEDDYLGDIPETNSGKRRRRKKEYEAKQADPRGNVQLALEGGAAVLVDADFFDPGVYIAGRGAYDFGYVLPEFVLGYQSNRANSGGPSIAGRDLERLQVGLGIRGHLPNPTPFTPFVSLGLDMNFWTWTGHSSYTCNDYFICTTSQDFELVPGLNTKLGVDWRIFSRVSLEIGAQLGMTFEGGPFNQNRFWTTPYLGVMFQ